MMQITPQYVVFVVEILPKSRDILGTKVLATARELGSW